MRICPECGKREIGPRAAMCEPCSKRRNYAYYKLIGICPRCRKQKLYNGQKICVECCAKSTERAYQKYWGDEKYREKVRSGAAMRSKRRYRIRKDTGICYYCGNREAVKGHTLCKICMIAIRNKQRLDIPRSERVSYGLCYFCGEPLDREGRSCSKCADRCRVSLEKNRRGRNEEWTRWNGLIFGRKVKDETQVSNI